MKTALIAGATGLIGRSLVEKILESGKYGKVFLVTRKPCGIVDDKITELITDFDLLSQLKFNQSVDDAFCTLGTTMKHAGSREKFKKVDYEYILSFARLAKKSGAKKFLVISSMGANPKSKVFYNQVKGQTEEALKNIRFKQLVILRPSLLLGERKEKRFGEQLGAFVMQSLRILIPDNYKAVKAEKVADKMLRMALGSKEPLSIVESGAIVRQS